MQNQSPAAERLLAYSRDHGYLAQPFFVMQSTPTNGPGPVAAALESHLRYWETLERDGVLFAAGPYLPQDPAEGGPQAGAGMVIFRAASSQGAERIAVLDPMHASGARHYTLAPWLLNHLRTSTA